MEEKPDLEIETPEIYAGIACPDLPKIDENLLLQEMNDELPTRIGADNDLGMEMPVPPDVHPDQPNIGQDCVVVQKDEQIVLEYEIEFPKGLTKKGDVLPILPGGICDIDMPEPPASIKEPEV